jgi:hypothetical protein
VGLKMRVHFPLKFIRVLGLGVGVGFVMYVFPLCGVVGALGL